MEMRLMPVRRLGKAHIPVPHVGNHGIDNVQDGGRRPKARLDRQVAEFECGACPGNLHPTWSKRGRLLPHPGPSILELLWVRALEAENRLLEVADHEDRTAPPLRRARSGEIFCCQCLHDLPLLLVRVLAFVDQNVIRAPIELVADPVAHTRRGQQTAGPVDEVVEVGHPGASLGSRVSGRESLSSSEAGSHVPGQPCAILDLEQLSDENGETAGMQFIVGLGLRLARRDAQRALLRQHDLSQIREVPRPSRSALTQASSR